MRQWAKIALAVVALVAAFAAAGMAGIYWYWCTPKEEGAWSSESAEARAELDAGVKDFEKEYLADAALHFERARELDPKSPAALAMMAFSTMEGESEHSKIGPELDALDASRFTDLERFLVRIYHARAKHDKDQFSAAVEDYLSRHPNEAFAFNMRCDLLWGRQKWDQAEACYRDLLTVQPQWVQAQDRLGQLFMSRGRFGEAEDQFITSRYVAPNQAGPYSSIGILYLLTGRYEESESSFRKALEVKRDFCPALSGLTHLYTVWGKLPEAIATIDTTEALCHGLSQGGNTCSRRIFIEYLQNDMVKAEEIDATCPAPFGYSLGKHQLAVWSGKYEQAVAMENAMAKEVEAHSAQNSIPFLSGFLHYLRGARLVGQADYSAADQEFTQAEADLRYWSGDTAILAFVNKVHRVYSLELAGRKDEAERVRQEISAVNPRLLENFKIPVLEARLAAKKH